MELPLATIIRRPVINAMTCGIRFTGRSSTFLGMTASLTRFPGMTVSLTRFPDLTVVSLTLRECGR
jgi:hypothetical protein